MLPVFLKLGGSTTAAHVFTYLLALLLVAYAAYSGWRSATGKPGGKKGEVLPANRNERLQKAALYGVVGAVLARLGLHYALPKEVFLGGRGEGIPVHTYGLMMAAGFMGAVALASELARREWGGALGEKRRTQIFDLAFWVFLAGVGGSKLLFIAVNWSDYSGRLGTYLSNPMKLVDCLGGGLVFYGGLIGAAIASYVFARKHDMEFLRLSDLALPAVSFGQAMGRLGCFAAGCCWGDAAAKSVPWAVTFPGKGLAQPLLGQSNTASLAFDSQLKDGRFVELVSGQVSGTASEGWVRISQWVAEHGHTLPLHPTQLYESMGQLCIMGGLLFLRRYRRFHGMISGLWLLCYATLRTTVELFRGDLERGTLHGLLETRFGAELAARVPKEAWYNVSTSQFISLCLFAFGLTLLYRQSRHLRTAGAEGSVGPGPGTGSAAAA